MNPAQRTGIAAAVVVLVGVGAAALALGDRGGDGVSPADESPSEGSGSAPAPDPQTQRAAAAGDALDALEEAVASGDPSGFADVYGGREGRMLYDTLAALPLAEWELRYIAEESRRAQTWVGDVEAQWSLDGFDERSVRVEVDVAFERAGGTVAITSIAPEEATRTPEWLLGETVVRNEGDTLVISTRPRLTDRVVAQSRRAVRDVHEVLSDSDDPVVVVVPEDTEQLEQLLGGEQSYEEIAAVTSTADGTSDPSAPVRVALNPPVYRGLGRVGAQVVLTHEVTHAVTDAAVTQVPLWLVEGFADYVALVDEPVPVDVAASQILLDVRRSGPPNQLPTEADFESTAGRLGASYEAAWLACRMLAERHGEDALIAFYRRTLASGDIEQAMRDTLGSDTEEVTQQWQAYLRRLA